VAITLPSELSVSLPTSLDLTLVTRAAVSNATGAVPTGPSTGCSAQSTSSLPLTITAFGCQPGEYVVVASKRVAVAVSASPRPAASTPSSGQIQDPSVKAPVSSGMSSGAVAGVVIALVCIVLAAGLITAMTIRRRRERALVEVLPMPVGLANPSYDKSKPQASPRARKASSRMSHNTEVRKQSVFVDQRAPSTMGNAPCSTMDSSRPPVVDMGAPQPVLRSEGARSTMGGAHSVVAGDTIRTIATPMVVRSAPEAAQMDLFDDAEQQRAVSPQRAFNSSRLSNHGSHSGLGAGRQSGMGGGVPVEPTMDVFALPTLPGDVGAGRLGVVDVVLSPRAASAASSTFSLPRRQTPSQTGFYPRADAVDRPASRVMPMPHVDNTFSSSSPRGMPVSPLSPQSANTFNPSSPHGLASLGGVGRGALPPFGSSTLPPFGSSTLPPFGVPAALSPLAPLAPMSPLGMSPMQPLGAMRGLPLAPLAPMGLSREPLRSLVSPPIQQRSMALPPVGHDRSQPAGLDDMVVQQLGAGVVRPRTVDTTLSQDGWTQQVQTCTCLASGSLQVLLSGSLVFPVHGRTHYIPCYVGAQVASQRLLSV
jgi:hypothetical protein